MKKIFIVLLFPLLIFLASTSSAFAINKASYPDLVRGYSLPYPGLLPDNRFYFLKMIRDKVVGLLISDPIKRVDFDILEADKRLNAGIFLLLEGEEKYSLATSTISKGENYFDDAVSKINSAKQQGIGVSEIKGELSDSLRKHREILNRLETNFSGTVKQDLQKDEEKVEQLQKSVGN